MGAGDNQKILVDLHVPDSSNLLILHDPCHGRRSTLGDNIASNVCRKIVDTQPKTMKNILASGYNSLNINVSA